MDPIAAHGAALSPGKGVRPKFATPEGKFRLVSDIDLPGWRPVREYPNAHAKISLITYVPSAARRAQKESAAATSTSGAKSSSAGSKSSGTKGSGDGAPNLSLRVTGSPAGRGSVVHGERAQGPSDDDPSIGVLVNIGDSVYLFDYWDPEAAPLEHATFSSAPVCHEFDYHDEDESRVSCLVGFSTGDIALHDPLARTFPRRFNKGGAVDPTACVAVRWVPGSSRRFFSAHASGCVYVWDIERREEASFLPLQHTAVPGPATYGGDSDSPETRRANDTAAMRRGDSLPHTAAAAAGGAANASGGAHGGAITARGHSVMAGTRESRGARAGVPPRAPQSHHIGRETSAPELRDGPDDMRAVSSKTLPSSSVHASSPSSFHTQSPGALPSSSSSSSLSSSSSSSSSTSSPSPSSSPSLQASSGPHRPSSGGALPASRSASSPGLPHGSTSGRVSKAAIAAGVLVTRQKGSRANPVTRWAVCPNHAITELVFSKSRTMFAVTSRDGRLRLFNHNEEKLLVSFRSYYGGLLCAAWSPDDRLVVTGGEDDLVSVWSVETRKLIVRCQGHRSWVSSVAFDHWRSEEGLYRVGSVGEDCRLCLWEIDTDELLAGELDAESQVGGALLGDRDMSRVRYQRSALRFDVPVLSPASSHRIHNDVASSLLFLEESLVTAGPSGEVKIWARPGMSEGWGVAAIPSGELGELTIDNRTPSRGDDGGRGSDNNRNDNDGDNDDVDDDDDVIALDVAATPERRGYDGAGIRAPGHTPAVLRGAIDERRSQFAAGTASGAAEEGRVEGPIFFDSDSDSCSSA